MERLVAGFIFSVLLSGCTHYVIPDVSRPQSSGIGIQIEPVLTGRLSIGRVYFVKIDDQDGLLQRGVFVSNYIKDYRAYLLNVRPGTYAAVAEANELSNGVQMTTYFSKEFVQATKVTIKEGELVFMGSYQVETSGGLDGADELQLHYVNVIGLTARRHARGTLREVKNNEASRIDFLVRAKEDLAGSKWGERIAVPKHHVSGSEPDERGRDDSPRSSPPSR